jgi:hypothetical protein
MHALRVSDCVLFSLHGCRPLGKDGDVELESGAEISASHALKSVAVRCDISLSLSPRSGRNICSSAARMPVRAIFVRCSPGKEEGDFA